MATEGQEQVQDRRLQTARLLRTKLYAPTADPDFVPRARLLQQLDQGRSRKLTLISAPAGFGKTSLLGQWIHERDLKVGWVSLDGSDNDLRRFWTYVVAALSVAFDLAQATLNLLQSPQMPPINTVLAELVNEITGGSRSLTLILDDYHAIEDPAIHEALAFLLDNMPPKLHLIIAGRNDPPLPIARLRAGRQLVELRARDLRFTEEETGVFLNQVMGLGLAAEDIFTLEERTEGWAAGLQLAALSMQAEADASEFIRTFTGSHRYVFDYLAQEVLRRQPEPIKTFLLKTSILERLSGSLCDAVTETVDASAMLEQLEQANLFTVSLDQERRWYRFHHLFADFLRMQAEKELGSDEMAALNRRASAWYANHGFIEEAVEHVLRILDYERAASLIEEYAGLMFSRGELNRLAAWSRALPDRLLARRPKLGAIFAWAQIATGNREDAERSVHAIEEAVGAKAELLASREGESLAPETRAALVEVSILQSTLAGAVLDPSRMLELAKQALPYLTEDAQIYLYNTPLQLRPGAFFNMALAYEAMGEVGAASEAFTQAATLAYEQRNLYIFPMALGHLAQLQVLQGRLGLAAETYRRALRLAKEDSGYLSPLAGQAFVGLGNLLYEWNDLDAALSSFEEGIALSRKWSYEEALAPGYIGLARLKWIHGDRESAFAALDEVVGVCQPAARDVILPLLDAARARFYVAQGDLGSAKRWAEKCGLETAEKEPELPYPHETEFILLARVLLAQKRVAEAQGLLTKLLAATRSGGRTSRVVEILAVQALSYQAQGNTSQALAELEAALALAEPEGYVRVFVDEGTPMAELLGIARARGVRLAYIDRLLAAMRVDEQTRAHVNDEGLSLPAAGSPQTTMQASRTGELLSDREREVLVLIARGLTNEQISNTLVVSVNTVKTHLKNIYGKLEVSSRTQAVAAARNLNLL